MDAILDIRDLSVNIDKKIILELISAPIYQQRITAVIGPSGCGKTTLLRAMNRSIEDDRAEVTGDICLEGHSIFAVPVQTVKREIGLIYQKPVPFPFSIYKNMSYALDYFGMTDKAQQRDIIIDKLQKAGLYDEVAGNLDMDARSLSGGQQQRLCIARSLTVEPRVLLLDEPCSSLDIKNTLKIEETLRGICEKCTVVIVTHNLSQAKRIADYTLFMDQGRAVEFGATAKLFSQAQEPQTREYISYVG